MERTWKNSFPFFWEDRCMYLWKVAPGCSRSVGTPPLRSRRRTSQVPKIWLARLRWQQRRRATWASGANTIKHRRVCWIIQELVLLFDIADDRFGMIWIYLDCLKDLFSDLKNNLFIHVSHSKLLNHDERMKLNCHTHPTWAACYGARQQTYGREMQEMLWIKWPLDGMSSLQRDWDWDVILRFVFSLNIFKQSCRTLKLDKYNIV